MHRVMPLPSARLNPEPNITPFIDVLLVLLVIFMLAVQVRHVFQVSTPPATRSAPVPGRSQIVLDLRADGSYAINRQPVPLGQLEAQLRAIYTGQAAGVLFVSAAPNRQYREVITAMDLGRSAGAKIVALVPPRSSH